MKNRFKGLGIFALLFSFILLTLGASELIKTSHAPSLPETEKSPQDVALELRSIKSQDGILQQGPAVRESGQTVRKFPNSLGLLFVLFMNPAAAESQPLPSSSFPAVPFAYPDISIAFHNLRI